MSAKAFHALITLPLGIAVAIIWLRTFWARPRAVPTAVLLAPLAAGILGLGHWIAYDFSLGHWASTFSLAQALGNAAVASALLIRRSAGVPIQT
jgi:hypothetical protein